MVMRIYQHLKDRLYFSIDITDEDFLHLMGLYETIHIRYCYNVKNYIDFCGDKTQNVRYSVANARGVLDRFKFLR